mgnify:CR=1 FL=1
MLKDEIVKLLEAEGEGYLSGQRISAQLGVSRAALEACRTPYAVTDMSKY